MLNTNGRVTSYEDYHVTFPIYLLLKGCSFKLLGRCHLIELYFRRVRIFHKFNCRLEMGFNSFVYQRTGILQSIFIQMHVCC